jgi:multiple sugar transport system ATP-binding protein
MAGIAVDRLVKTYPAAARRAVDDVSLEVDDGEFVVLVGPSGCGKTTLLRMVAGLERPDSGTVHIGDKNVTGIPARLRGVSMVFQSYAVFPHMTVAQNIGFGLAMHKVAKAEQEARVRRAADMLHLDELLDRYPTQLSGGQRQRVAVARAIVMDAAVLLMDEPLSNLDALLRLQFRAELKKIVREVGATTLYVTHDQAEAMSLGDRVAVLRSGRVMQIGGVLDVYNEPASQFVGGFLGSPPMNFLTAVVRDGSLAVGSSSLPAPAFASSWDGRSVLVGVRAEKIALVDAGGVPAIVEVVEPTGAAVLLTVVLGGQRLKVAAPADFRAIPDDTVRLGIDAGSLRLFDPETSLALLA